MKAAGSVKSQRHCGILPFDVLARSLRCLAVETAGSRDLEWFLRRNRDPGVAGRRFGDSACDVSCGVSRRNSEVRSATCGYLRNLAVDLLGALRGEWLIALKRPDRFTRADIPMEDRLVDDRCSVIRHQNCSGIVVGRRFVERNCDCCSKQHEADCNNCNYRRKATKHRLHTPSPCESYCPPW